MNKFAGLRLWGHHIEMIRKRFAAFAAETGTNEAATVEANVRTDYVTDIESIKLSRRGGTQDTLEFFALVIRIRAATSTPNSVMQQPSPSRYTTVVKRRILCNPLSVAKREFVKAMSMP